MAVGRERVSRTSRDGKPLPAALARKAKIADALVFKKIRHALGANFRFAVSGGAPLSKDLAEFFVGAGVTIYEGYGLTETSPVITVNGPGRWRLGTVGKPLRGRRGQDRAGRRDPDARSARHEGLLQQAGGHRRGDRRGRLVPHRRHRHTSTDGFLAITDRKKDLIVLAGGKKAAPQPIENELKKSPFVALSRSSSATGRSSWPRSSCPTSTSSRSGPRQNAPDVRWEAIDAASARSASSSRRRSTATTPDQPHHEQIRAFAILPSDLTIEDGSITPTLKVKRRILENRYHSLIEGMYEAAGKSHVA